MYPFVVAKRRKRTKRIPRNAAADTMAAAELAERISRWLAFRDLTQVELARRVSVAPSTVTNWIRGRGFPGYSALLRLTAALGTTPSVFFGAVPS